MAIATVVETVQPFDYEALDQETRTWLGQTESDVRFLMFQLSDLVQQYGAKVIQLGEKLAQVRDRLSRNKKGGFQAWLQHHGWASSTAYECIKAFERLGGRSTLEGVDISVAAIYKLAAGTTPPDVREEIIARAEAGERITSGTVKSLLKDSPATLSDGCGENSGLPTPKPAPVVEGESVQVRSGQFVGQVGVVRGVERDYAIVEMPEDGNLVPVMYSELLESDEDEAVGVGNEDIDASSPTVRPETKNPPPGVTLPFDRFEGIEARLKVEQERVRLLSQENRELKASLGRVQTELNEEIAYSDALYEFLISVLEHLPAELQNTAKTLLGGDDEG